MTSTVLQRWQQCRPVVRRFVAAAVIGPLPPGLYHYQLTGDDTKTIKDPTNPTSVTSQPNWSTFLVPGDSARLLADVPAGRGGAIGKLTYHSSVVDQDRTAYVWTPPGYDAGRATPYPVLYLQHGGGQSYTDWLEMGRAKQILDNEFRAGQLEPMVVVMGNGNVPDFTTELLGNIVPAARAAYHVASDPGHQALAGLSMGGFQAYDVLRSHPGEFGYVGTFSAAMFDSTGLDVAAVNSGTRLLRVYTGNVTDFVYPMAMATMATFDRLGGEVRVRRGHPGAARLGHLAAEPHRLRATPVPGRPLTAVRAPFIGRPLETRRHFANDETTVVGTIPGPRDRTTICRSRPDRRFSGYDMTVHRRPP